MTVSSGFFQNKNILIGIILLVIAGSIGFFVYKKPAVIETDLFVPIQTDIAEQSITVISPQSGGINLRVRGSVKAIAGLSSRNARVHLDKMKLGNGVQTIPIDSKKIGLPPDVSIVNIHPPVATIRIEPLIEKALPIIVALTGKPAVGFYVAEMIVDPDTVRVQGPKSVVQPQTQIQIKPIDIHGVSESFEQRIALDLPDGLKPIQPDQFTLKVTVKEKIVSTQLANIPIQGRGAQRAFRISPPTLTMKIKGPFRTVQHITESPDFSVYVDLAGLDPGVYVRRAVIILPVDVALVKTDPKLFTIRIAKK